MDNGLSRRPSDAADIEIARATQPYDDSLEEQWRIAAVEVIHAQQEYVGLERYSDSHRTEWRTAWLRLWDAENKLRAIDHAIRHVAPAYASASCHRFTPLHARPNGAD